MKLPKGWNIRKVKDFAEVITGGTPSTTKKEYWDGGDIPWLPSGDMKNKPIIQVHKFITKKGLENSAAKIMPKKTVAIALTGATTGKVGILDLEASANQSVTGILPSREHIPEYLFYFLQTIRSKILSESYGGAQPHISQEYIKNLEVVLPPLPIQKKIVSILEKAEKAKERRKEADELISNFLKSVFLEMFGDPGTNPKNFPKKNLLSISSEKPKYGSGASAVTYDGKRRYIRITDVDSEGNLRSDSVVSPSNFEEEYLLQKGDLIFARTGATVGKTYLNQRNNIDSIYAGYMIRFRFKKGECNPVFVYYSTKSNYYRGWVNHIQTQATQPNINAKQYGTFEIPLPPIELQNKFASIVKEVEVMKNKQKQSKERLDNLFNALMQKAFKGELV